MTLRILLPLVMILSLILPTSPIKAEENKSSSVNLSILATTDVHANMMDYDYYSDKPTTEFGLARTAQLIEKHRRENPNTLLVDNGDLIQGNPLGEYAVKYEKNDIISGAKTHPIIEVMNSLHYDAGTLGNHEFNYGLEFLDGTIKGADYPIVNANVKTLSGENRYTPYVIKDKTVTDENGGKHQIKVGYIGFVPPQIMTWDKKNLEGRVQVEDIVESAKKTVPKMKAEGADIVIALAHSGIEKKRSLPERKTPFLTWQRKSAELMRSYPAISTGFSLMPNTKALINLTSIKARLTASPLSCQAAGANMRASSTSGLKKQTARGMWKMQKAASSRLPAM